MGKLRTFISAIASAARELVAAKPEGPPAEILEMLIRLRDTLQDATARAQAPEPAPPPVVRTPLPIVSYVGERSSGAMIPRAITREDGVVSVIARPQVCAFRVEELRIDNPELWMIHDVKIGNASQFVQPGPIPATLLSSLDLSFQTLQTAMDLTIRAEYIGNDGAGAVFHGAAVGTSAAW